MTTQFSCLWCGIDTSGLSLGLELCNDHHLSTVCDENLDWWVLVDKSNMDYLPIKCVSESEAGKAIEALQHEPEFFMELSDINVPIMTYTEFQWWLAHGGK